MARARSILRIASATATFFLAAACSTAARATCSLANLVGVWQIKTSGVSEIGLGLVKIAGDTGVARMTVTTIPRGRGRTVTFRVERIRPLRDSIMLRVYDPLWPGQPRYRLAGHCTSDQGLKGEYEGTYDGGLGPRGTWAMVRTTSQ
jgi:hypothetical protein